MEHYTLLNVDFFNFNPFSKLFLKLTPGKHYLHPVTPLAAPGGMA
jgi:hypothetical protein